MFWVEVYCFHKHSKQLLTLMDSPTIEFGRMPYEISPMGIYEDNDEYSVNCDV